jgi:dinuclear metal center YbgI/SA1388 family protein
MKIDTIIDVLDTCLHPSLQEDYDNSGSQIVFRGSDVSSIMISLDIDFAVLDEAVAKKCGLIVTHHPLFFNALKKLDTVFFQSSLIVRLIDNRVNLYSAHTNLDKIFYDKLAKAIGFNVIKPLYPNPPSLEGIPAGFGALVELDTAAELEEILAKVKKSLNLDFVVFTGDTAKKVSRIALMNGAGGRSIEKIVRDGAADCVITGDVGYHQAKFAADHGVAVLDAGHFGTEIIMLGFLRDLISDCLTNQDAAADIPIYISESEKNPFRVYNEAHE